MSYAFTYRVGKALKGRELPMNKKAWAKKFKKYTVLAGVNEPKKSWHGVRKREQKWQRTPSAPKAR
jgi:hypothetical protein